MEKNIFGCIQFSEEQNPESRPEMEDFGRICENFCNDRNKLLLLVFDGHNGEDVAKKSIELFPVIFENVLKTESNIEKALKIAFSNLEEKFKEYEETGTTATVCYLCIENGKKILYTANCGDSRAVIVKKDKSATRLSYDHKASDKVEKSRITSLGGVFFNGRFAGILGITRNIGCFKLKNDIKCPGLICEPYLSRTEIEPDHTHLVVATDGIWDQVQDDDLGDIFEDYDKTTNAAKIIIDQAITYGSGDNCYCIVVNF